MNFQELGELIFAEIVPKIKNHQGLSIFARERAKFEGWLKVELCDSLLRCFQDVAPERDLIDITFDDWAIQLKTVNTIDIQKKIFKSCSNRKLQIIK